MKKVEIIQTRVVFHLNIGHIVQLQSIYSVISCVQQLVYNRSCTIIRAIPGERDLESFCVVVSLQKIRKLLLDSSIIHFSLI